MIDSTFPVASQLLPGHTNEASGLPKSREAQESAGYYEMWHPPIHQMAVECGSGVCFEELGRADKPELRDYALVEQSFDLAQM